VATNNGHPSFPKGGVQKYDKDTDEAVKAKYEAIYNTDGQQVVMPEVFKARVKAQMDRGKRGK